MLWELDYGKWADKIQSPEAAEPDPFFGGHQNKRAATPKLDPPVIREDLNFFWCAWQDLRSERLADGTIPWRAMRDYALTYRADLYILKLIVWELDQAFVSKRLEQIKAKTGDQDGRSRNSSSNRSQ